jgi:glutathione S-transferase
MHTLYTSATTPFGRKVAVVLMELGLSGEVERKLINPWEDAAIYAVNPLGKIPVLVLKSGETLIESAEICDALCEMAGERGALMLPSSGAARRRQLYLQAVADGAIAAGVLAMREGLRPDGERSPSWRERQVRAMVNAGELLEKETARGDFAVPGTEPTLGECAVACLLGYFDLRFADVAWRQRWPALAAWHASIAARPSYASTVPVV